MTSANSKTISLFGKMLPSSYQRIEDDSNIPDTNGHSSNDNEPKWRSLLRSVSGRIRRVDRSFIVSKLFYLFFYTALGALFPFFALFYKQLWLSAWQIGLLLALRPSVKLVCLPLWKMITDQYSRPRAIYFISIFGWLIGYYGQSFVYQSDVPCYKWTSWTNDVAAVQPPNVSLDTNIAPLITPKHALKSRNIKRSSLDSSDFRPWDPLQYRGNTKRKNKAVAKVKDVSKFEGEKAPFFHLNTHVAPKDTKTLQKRKSSAAEKFGFVTSALSESSKNLEQKKLNEEGQGETNNFILDENSLDDISIGMDSHHRNRRSIEAFDEINKQSPHPSRDFRVRYNYWIFRTLVVIVILTEIVTTPTPMLADIAIVQALIDTDSEYGNQRLFGSLGLTIAAALVAVWVSQITNCSFTDTINYLPCFYIFEIAIGITVLVSLFFKFETRREETYDLSDALKLFKNFKNGMFLFTLFVFGFAHGVQMSFLFWFLQDIGGGPVLFALIILVHCLAEVVTYFVSTFLVDKIGQLGMVCLALACYTARYSMQFSYTCALINVIPMGGRGRGFHGRGTPHNKLPQCMVWLLRKPRCQSTLYHRVINNLALQF